MRATKVLALGAVGALALVACGGSDDMTDQTTSSTTASKTSTTTAKGGGKHEEGSTACDGCPTYGETDTTISATAGDEFVIVLDSNPSTGYRWTATSSDPGVVRVAADEYVAPDTNLLGAPGVQRFLLDPVAAGSATLQLRYARSFEPDDPNITTLSFAVTVT
jgi:inhibitor of cysteine peptidase